MKYVTEMSHDRSKAYLLGPIIIVKPKEEPKEPQPRRVIVDYELLKSLAKKKKLSLKFVGVKLGLSEDYFTQYVRTHGDMKGDSAAELAILGTDAFIRGEKL